VLVFAREEEKRKHRREREKDLSVFFFLAQTDDNTGSVVIKVHARALRAP